MQSSDRLGSAPITHEFPEELRVAQHAVALAEAELNKAVAEMTTSPRWMKTVVSVELARVFSSLRGAKEKLAQLERAASAP